MKTKIISILLIISLIGSPSFSVFAQNTTDVQKQEQEEALKKGDYKEGELIVTFKDDVSNKTIDKIVTAADADLDNVIKVEDTKITKVDISSNDEIEDAIEKLESNPKVEEVQPNYRYHIYETDNSVKTLTDELTQYHLDIVKANEAWSLIEANNYSTTKVAVIDTGVDVYHEDLNANLESTKEYTATIGGKEIKKDADTDEHGTHVAGIIGATYGNKIGGSGVASGTNNDLVEVMMIGASPDGYNLYTADVIEAINYAKNNGAKVINMSFGVAGRDRAMEKTIKSAYENGIVLVAAAGNEEDNSFNSPSDFKEVIGVNASNEYNKPTYWSNYNTYKDITAPGKSIVSTLPGDIYGKMDGTSMASPVVAAIAALILDANSSLTPAEVYNIICASTNQPSFDDYLAYGIINAKEAVQAAISANPDVNVTSLSLKNDFIQVYEDDNYALESLIRPATSLKKITWTSSNPDIATVDQNGLVTGIKAGFTTVTATVDGKTATTDIRVVKSNKQAGITISNKEKYAKLTKGVMQTLKAQIMPEDSTNKEVYWTSSDRTIADIDELGNLTAINLGTATITAKTYDGKYTDSFEVTVLQDAKKVKFTKTVSKMLVGDTFTYEATAYGDDETLEVNSKELIWSSTDEGVAKVDPSTGTVTALKPGITYIVATVKETQNNIPPVNKVIRLAVGKKEYAAKDYGLKITSKTYNSATLKWNKFLVADHYIIERATNIKGPYKKIKETTATTYKDTNLSLNKTYYYRVKTVYNPEKSFNYSLVKSAKITLNTPVVTLKQGGTRAIKVSWNKIPGANGYTVYRATSKAGTYKAIKSTKYNYYTNKKLTKNKKYYYKVRAYKLVNGKKVYSPYSTIKMRVAR